MSDKTVFLVTELWLIPGAFSKLKKYRTRLNDILEKYTPEYIFHNHAFEWITGDNGESYPTGIEIIKFANEKRAREALAEINSSELKQMEHEIFSRTRSYLSRHDFPNSLTEEIFKTST